MITVKTVGSAAIAIVVFALIVWGIVGIIVHLVKPIKHTYVVTERGLISYHRAYCALGMLTNDAGVNLLDENSNPMTCSGLIHMTKAAAKEYNDARKLK